MSRFEGAKSYAKKVNSVSIEKDNGQLSGKEHKRLAKIQLQEYFTVGFFLTNHERFETVIIEAYKKVRHRSPEVIEKALVESYKKLIGKSFDNKTSSKPSRGAYVEESSDSIESSPPPPKAFQKDARAKNVRRNLEANLIK